MANNGYFNTSSYDGAYLIFNWSVASQSIANNTTTINWKLTGAGITSGYWYMAGNFKVTINGQQVYYSSNRIQLYTGTEVASGQLTIAHDSVGKKSFSASAEAGIYTYAVNVSGSGSWSLPDIPRQATITSAPNFNDTQNPTIQYTNPAGNNVTTLQACIAITGSIPVQYRDISKTGTSYTFELTEAERNALRSASANSKTLDVTFHVKTIIGGNTLYSTSTKKMTLVDANPTFNIGYGDFNTTTTAITGNPQQIIQNCSRLSINVTRALTYKYATLSKAEVVINGVKYTGTFTNQPLTGNTSIIEVGEINISQNVTASVTVYDSRGYTTTKTFNITVLSWELPSAITTLNRKNNYYSETELTVDARYSSLDNKNSVTIQYQYKKVTESTYSTLQTLQDNVTELLNLDNLYQWDIKVIITDRLGSTTYNLPLDKGMPILFIDRLLNSLGVNCFPKRQLSVEIDGKSVMPITLYDNASGSGNTITLNDNVNNYSYIEILYTDNNNAGYGATKVYNANGKTVDLSLTEPSDTKATITYIRRTAYEISGTTITPNTSTSGYVQISSRTVSTTTGSNYIKIYRVIGWE